MKKYLPLALLPCLLLAEEEYLLENVQVTATRTERSELETPAGVATITEEELETRTGLNTYELFQGISGVQVTTRNSGYDVRLIIRGAGLKAPYGVREINVLLDGVPITDPDGFTRMDFVDTMLVERVEVVKGPNSTMWGANSGGVVNFITLSPFKFQGFRIKGGVGNYQTYMFNAVYGGNKGGWLFYNLSTTYKKSDSWREWNRFESFQTTLKLGFNPDAHSVVESTISFTKADLQLPGSLTKEEFEEDPTQQTSSPWRKSGRYSKIFFWSGKYERDISPDLRLRTILYLQRWTHYHPVTARINDGGSYVGGLDSQVEYRHTLFGIKSTLLTGLQVRYDHYDSNRYLYKYCKLADGTYNLCSSATRDNPIEYVLSDEKGELADEQKNRNLMIGVFVQETLKPTVRTLVDLGLRFDHVVFDIEKTYYWNFAWGRNYYYPYNEQVNTRKTFNALSPRIGVVYRFNRNLSAYGTISTGFLTPQDSEVLTNPDLNPAKLTNYEVGLKGAGRNFRFSTALYYTTVKDDIVYTILPDGTRTYMNAGKTLRRGFELDGSLRVFKHLVVGGAYSYFNYEYDDFKEYIYDYRTRQVLVYDRSGNKLPYIPDYIYTLYLRWWPAKGFRFSIDTTTWGPYYVDNANTETYDGYELITNLTVGYANGRKWGLYLDVNNLFDKKYASVYQKDIDGDTYIYPGPPRTYMLRAYYMF